MAITLKDCRLNADEPIYTIAESDPKLWVLLGDIVLILEDGQEVAAENILARIKALELRQKEAQCPT